MIWQNKKYRRNSILAALALSLTIVTAALIYNPVKIFYVQRHPAFLTANAFVNNHPQLASQNSSNPFKILTVEDSADQTTPLANFHFHGALTGSSGTLTVEVRHNPGQDWIITQASWLADNNTKLVVIAGPNEWLTSANTALMAKQIDTAKTLCADIIKSNEHDFRGPYCAALVAFQEGDPERANRIMADLSKTYPLTQVVHILKADLLLKSGKRAESISSYVDAWNLGAKAEIAAVIATYHQDLNDSKNALIWLNKARDAGLLSADIFYGYGRYYFAQSDYPRALSAFEQTVARNATHTNAWSGIGLCYQKLNLGNQAIAAYQKAIQSNPKNALNVRKNLSQIFLASEHFDQALTELQNTLSYHPDDIDTLAWLTLLYVRSGRTKEAQAVYAKLKERAPERADQIVQSLNLKSRSNNPVQQI